MKKSIFLLLITLFFNCRKEKVSISIKANKNTIVVVNGNSIYKNMKVTLVDKETKEEVLIEGNFKLEGKNISFTPSFPLLENIDYKIIADNFTQTFSISSKKKKFPKVVTIYPTSNTLPENLLRMYIVFSQPMKTIGNLEKIKLIDEEGKKIKAIFNNVYELWNDDQTQLTIIFDPARVKTGLIANEKLGRALQPNKKYRLVIDELEDIYGNKLSEIYEKKFQVISQDIQSPNTENWKISTPKSKTKNPLQINFTESIDKMSLESRLVIVDENKKVVQGKIQIKNEETTWMFFPEKNWNKGNYTIKINSRLSDPSGNNLNGLFDHKIGSLKNKQEGEILDLFFQI